MNNKGENPTSPVAQKPVNRPETGSLGGQPNTGDRPDETKFPVDPESPGSDRDPATEPRHNAAPGDDKQSSAGQQAGSDAQQSAGNQTGSDAQQSSEGQQAGSDAQQSAGNQTGSDAQQSSEGQQAGSNPQQASEGQQAGSSPQQSAGQQKESKPEGDDPSAPKGDASPGAGPQKESKAEGEDFDELTDKNTIPAEEVSQHEKVPAQDKRDVAGKDPLSQEESEENNDVEEQSSDSELSGETDKGDKYPFPNK
ncbi:hypothetical protein MKQ68_21705 [Chitinophaga horti]|uniref:Uncharacterized protein n=1 Tax=Chitinophaga horti TaxID=2920382 RepID=A0ABY6IZJ2_9BACT|nr:hypothetical protein [Chitinophaga horti]UYQ92698.1 hypothetical protein MKQ68_21705 [Chitinophaga horti]